MKSVDVVALIHEGFAQILCLGHRLVALCLCLFGAGYCSGVGIREIFDPVLGYTIALPRRGDGAETGDCADYPSAANGGIEPDRLIQCNFELSRNLRRRLVPAREGLPCVGRKSGAVKWTLYIGAPIGSGTD